MRILKLTAPSGCVVFINCDFIQSFGVSPINPGYSFVQLSGDDPDAPFIVTEGPGEIYAAIEKAERVTSGTTP